jgi:2,4-diaminopentanoate dehydrogenase
VVWVVGGLVVFRVIQWASGAVGGQCLKLILQDPGLELVGLFCYAPEKVGRDAGELVGLPACGVVGTNDREAVLAADADVVVHAALLTPDSWPQFDTDVADLLRSGKNVITTGTYWWPWIDGEEYAERFIAAGRAGNATLFGTGMHPGVLFDRIAPTLSTMCGSVESVSFTEVDDVGQHPSWAMLHGQMFMGRRAEEYRRDSPPVQMFRRMWGQCCYQVAAQLGLVLDRLDLDLAVGLATADIELRAGVIRKGTIAGTRTVLRGMVDEVARVSLEINWYVDPDIPGWPETGRVWRTEIEGRPSWCNETRIARTLGDRAAVPWYDGMGTATAAPAIYAIPAIVAAEPGIFVPPVFTPYRFRGRARTAHPILL